MNSITAIVNQLREAERKSLIQRVEVYNYPQWATYSHSIFIRLNTLRHETQRERLMEYFDSLGYETGSPTLDTIVITVLNPQKI